MQIDKEAGKVVLTSYPLTKAWFFFRVLFSSLIGWVKIISRTSTWENQTDVQIARTQPYER